MNSMNCTDFKAMLSAYIDDELDDQARHTAECHVNACDACRTLVDQAERLDALVASDVQSRQPAGVSPDFFGAVLSRTAYAEPRSSGRFMQWMTWTGWTAAAAAFTVASVIWLDQSQPVQLADNEQAETRDAQGSAAQTTAGQNEARHASRSIYPASYSVADTLQSATFEQPLPADVFRSASSQQETATEATDEAVETASQDTQRKPVLGQLVRNFSSSMLDAATRFQQSSRSVLLAGIAVEFPEQADNRADAQMQRPTINREDADTLYATSILMDVLGSAELGSFADVEHVRQVVHADNLLPRLTAARDRLQPADRPAVLAAESVLTRVVRGPLDTDDVATLRDTVTSLDLSNELASITERWDRASSL